MKPTKSTPFRRLVTLFPKRYLLIGGVLISIAYSSITVLFGYLLKVLIDAAGEGARETFFLVLQVSLGLLVLNAFLTYFRTRLIGKYTESGLAKLRGLYAEKVAVLTYDTLQSKHSGELSSRGTNDMNRVRDFTFNTIPRLIEVPLTGALALIVIIILSWQLTVFALAMIPVLVIGSSLLIKPIGPASKQVQEKLGAINTVNTDFIQGIEVAKAYTLEARLAAKHDGLVEESVQAGKQLARRRGILGAFSQGFSIIPFLTTFVFGGYLVIEGRMTLGSLLAFINLLNFLTWPLSQMSVLIGDTKRDLASAERIFEMIDSPIERTDGHTFAVDATQPAVVFEDVSFAYPGHEEPVIRNVSFSVKMGETIAFVGPSGGGKSTITKLLMGYYDNYSGTILIFGHDLRTWNLTALRNALSLVTQETFLFPESIAENIHYGNLDLDVQSVEEAAKKAQADTFIMAHPDGYHAILGEMGDTLSGGQKQRLAIARSIMKDAPIVLLDEATSALDLESEALVQEALDTMLQEKTGIVIAHRLSTIRHADTIHVLENGTLVESGTHDRLLEAAGTYARLYQRQRLFADEEGTYETLDL